MISDLNFKSSNVFANFSIVEIIKRLNSYSGLICANGSMGGVGMGTSHGDHEKSRFRNHDSFSCHLKADDKEKFNQAEIIQELFEKTKNEVAKFGARVTGESELNSSSFSLEYTDENITGRIEIKCSLHQEDQFRVKVSFDETSSSQKNPIVERPLISFQPTGNYHVVAFASDDKEAREFYEKGQIAYRESDERFRQKFLADKDNFREENYRAIIYVWTRMPDYIKERIKDRLDKFVELPSEYDSFNKVYFLNDLALQMYREANVEIDVVKTIPAEEMAKLLDTPSFQGYYVPKE